MGKNDGIACCGCLDPSGGGGIEPVALTLLSAPLTCLEVLLGPGRSRGVIRPNEEYPACGRPSGEVGADSGYCCCPEEFVDDRGRLLRYGKSGKTAKWD